MINDLLSPENTNLKIHEDKKVCQDRETRREREIEGAKEREPERANARVQLCFVINFSLFSPFWFREAPILAD